MSPVGRPKTLKIPRPGSPPSSASSLMISAPRSASITVETGPCCQIVQSTTRIPSSGVGMPLLLLCRLRIATDGQREVGVAHPLRHRPIVDGDVRVVEHRESERVDRRGNPAAAVGDYARARERAGTGEAFSELGDRAEDSRFGLEEAVVEDVVASRNVPGAAVDVRLPAVD